MIPLGNLRPSERGVSRSLREGWAIELSEHLIRDSRWASSCRTSIQRRAASRLGVFQHLLIASRVAKRRLRMLPEEEIDIFRLADAVVVQQKVLLPNEDGMSLLVVGVLGLQR